MGESGSSLSWDNLTGDYGKKLDLQERQRAGYTSQLNELAKGELPASMTDPITEKYTDLATKQGSYLAGQFGGAGRSGSGAYEKNAFDLQKSLGKEYTSELGRMAYGQKMGALGMLSGMPDKYNQPGPGEIINTLGKVASGGKG